jgi:hypothetical protein
MAQISYVCTTVPQDCADHLKFKCFSEDQHTVIIAVNTTGTRNKDKKESQREKGIVCFGWKIHWWVKISRVQWLLIRILVEIL